MVRAVGAERAAAEGEGRAVGALDLAHAAVAVERVRRAAIAQLDGVAHALLYVTDAKP